MVKTKERYYLCDEKGNKMLIDRESLIDSLFLKKFKDEFGEKDDLEHVDKYCCITKRGQKTLINFKNLLISKAHFLRSLNLIHRDIYGDNGTVLPFKYGNSDLYGIEYDMCVDILKKDIKDVCGFDVSFRDLPKDAILRDDRDCVIIERTGYGH